MARVSSGKRAKRAANKALRKSGRAAKKAEAHYLRMGPKGSSSASPQQRHKRGPEWGKKKTNHKRGLAATEQAQKRADAEERQKMRNERSPQQQIDELDSRLGKNIGAEKERKKLQQLIDKQAAATPKKADPAPSESERVKLPAKLRNQSGVSGGRIARD